MKRSKIPTPDVNVLIELSIMYLMNYVLHELIYSINLRIYSNHFTYEQTLVEVNPPIRTKNLLRNASHRLAYIAVVLYIEERRTEGG